MDYFTVVFLLNADRKRIVLLKRVSTARLFPNRWTGIGGSVEPGEKVENAALRELLEETGIKANELKLFRRIADFEYEGGSFWPSGYTTSYFDCIYSNKSLPPCNEGDLQWINVSDMNNLDIIDDTKAALKIFVEKVFWKEIDKALVGNFITSKNTVTDQIVLK